MIFADTEHDGGFMAGIEAGSAEVHSVRNRARRVARHNVRLRRIVAFQAAVIAVLFWWLVAKYLLA